MISPRKHVRWIKFQSVGWVGAEGATHRLPVSLRSPMLKRRTTPSTPIAPYTLTAVQRDDHRWRGVSGRAAGSYATVHNSEQMICQYYNFHRFVGLV